ncbi:phosphotransferase [Streptomyces carpaticus]|uniref:phosphotransferase n=1 Tax=Streptomyces carpaticus TaxID=285558 RepID=UPI0031F7954A
MSSDDIPELSHIPERTDPAIARLIVADANHTHGTSYHLVEPMHAGFQAGTWLLRNGENESAVLKWSPNRSAAPQLLRAADAVERARDAGYPTPAWLAVGVAKSGFPYHIQQYVPGSSPTRAFDYATLLTVDDIDRAGWNLTRATGEQVAGPGVLAHCFAMAALDLADFVRQRNPGRLPLIIGPLTDRTVALLP